MRLILLAARKASSAFIRVPFSWRRNPQNAEVADPEGTRSRAQEACHLLTFHVKDFQGFRSITILEISEVAVLNLGRLCSSPALFKVPNPDLADARKTGSPRRPGPSAGMEYGAPCAAASAGVRTDLAPSPIGGWV